MNGQIGYLIAYPSFGHPSTAKIRTTFEYNIHCFITDSLRLKGT